MGKQVVINQSNFVGFLHRLRNRTSAEVDEEQETDDDSNELSSIHSGRPPRPDFTTTETEAELSEPCDIYSDQSYRAGFPYD